MITVRFRRDSRQRLSSVLATGHAESAAYGEDVVCAGVSAILQAAELGLAAHAKLAGATTRRDDGFMSIVLPAGERERVDVVAIVATAELAIEQLARQFPTFVEYVTETEPGEAE